MRYKNKRRIVSVLAAIFAAVIFITVPASALTWDGTAGGGSGGGGINAPNAGYSVLDTTATACGYRFSRVDYYGETINDAIDIICSNYDKADIMARSKFDTKLNKVQLKDRMSLDITWETSVNNTNVYKDIDILDDKNTKEFDGIALPTDTSKIESTVMNGDVFDKICKALGMSGGASDLQNGDKVLVEPIFALTLKGEKHALTVSEIGIFGREEFHGYDPADTSNDQDTFGFIAKLTNKIWPSSLYNTDTKFWSAGYDASVKSGPASNAKGLISFDNLLLYGFGVAFVYDNKNPPITPVDLYPTGVTYWTSQTGGTQVTNLVEGNTYWPRFTYHNKGDISVNATVSIYSYPLRKYDSEDVGITIDANSDYTVNSEYPVIITNDLDCGTSGEKSDDYEYGENTLAYKLSITLNDSKATESDTDNNTGTYTANFAPLQPNINQTILDSENAASSWITDAVNNRIIYSGEQIGGKIVFQNNSLFNLNVFNRTQVAIGGVNGLGYSYLSFPGTINDTDTAFRNSKAVWNYFTSSFRPKNVPVNILNNNSTQSTLYLLSAAEETSYASAMGTSIKDWDSLAEMVELNTLAFYDNTVYDNDGNSLTQSWDNNARILTLNGRLDSSTNETYINYDFKKGGTYKITVEYVSGSVTTEKLDGEDRVRSVMVFDFGYANGPRIWSDLYYPNLKAMNIERTVSGYINLTRDESTMAMWLWCGDNQPNVYFDNYQVRVKIERITESLIINDGNLFMSGTVTDSASGTDITQNWDSANRILTLNGTFSGNGDELGESQYTEFSDKFYGGETYKLTLEYISGDISGTKWDDEDGFGACMAFDWTPDIGVRTHRDIAFPHFAEDSSEDVTSNIITMPCDATTVRTMLWTNASRGEVLTFNNYKIKVTVERIDGLSRYLSYSSKLEAYTVIPTDLETSKIGLYDAETNERLSEDVKLQAGQRVYSETTYTNHTDTAVAVSLNTKHDNNSYTEYYVADETDLSNSINVKESEIPLSKLLPSSISLVGGGTCTYDKSTGIMTLNGRIRNESDGSNYFAPIDCTLKYGEKYVLTVTYLDGTVSGETGTTVFFGQCSVNGYEDECSYDAIMPHTVWKSSDTTTIEFQPKLINGSLSGQRLYFGIWCDGEDTTFDNYRLQVSVKKVNPYVSWDEENQILSVNGEYSRNRELYRREIFDLSVQESADGKVSFGASGEDCTSAITLSINGTVYGADYLESLFKKAIMLGDLTPGDKFRLKAEYVSGSITEASSSNVLVLPLSWYHSDGSRHAFVDLALPKTVENSENISISSRLTIGDCDDIANDYLQLGLHSQDNNGYTYATFDNYTIKITLEVVNEYSSVNKTEISDAMAIGSDDNYLLKIEKVSGYFSGYDSSIIVEYLNDTGTVVNTQEVSVSTGNTVSLGVTAPDSDIKLFRLSFKSNTGFTEEISYDNLNLSLVLIKKSASVTQCNINSISNSEYSETCVIAPNESVTIRSSIFTVSAVPHNKIELSAYIYIKGLVGNTEYEYVEDNNTKSATYMIETPFKPTVIQANSEYRRGITVITSFEIKNNSYLDFGNQADIDNIGVLSANLKVYTNSSLTGAPIADVDCIYAVPGNGKSTLVWFEWTVPVDSPDNLYAQLVCDDNNRYSSPEFVDNGDNSKNTYCTFNIVQPKVMSTPDTTFAKAAPYWYNSGASSASVPNTAEGLKAVYNQDAVQIKSSTQWSYYKANGNTLELVTETATLSGSSVSLIPDGTKSAYIGYDNKWNIKSGYGFKIDTEFKENTNSTNVQSGYAVFPEFLFKIEDDNVTVNGYTNGAGTRIGFKDVLGKYPECGGEYATYSTLEKTKDGKLILPINDSSHTPTHFIPIWYPNSDYRIYCYVADCWTPGGMLSGQIRSYLLHVNGNMYDDYRVSEK